MSDLLKIPCILLAMIGLNYAITPPQPPPSVSESAPSTRLEVVLRQRWGVMLNKIICWSAALSEISVILASHSQFLPISRFILSSPLVPLRGGAEKIAFTPLFLLGTCMACLAGFIRAQCFATLGKMFTYEMSIRSDHRLVTTGPYAIVRHPAYTGILLLVAGVVCIHASSGSWARESGILTTIAGQAAAVTYLMFMSFVLVGLLRRMSMEDRALKQTFGKEWDEWAKNISCKLIPYVY